MKKKINIYRIYHDKSLLNKYPLNSYEIFYDTSNNIYHKFYNEFCCILDDNLDLDCEYIGFEHYRRIFDIDMNRDYNKIVNYIGDNNCITYESFDIKIEYPYLKYIGYDLFYDQLKIYFQTFENTKYSYFFEHDLYIRRSMFIMKTANYLKLKKFIKECYKYLCKLNNIVNVERDVDRLGIKDIELNRYSYLHSYRCLAYVGEFLINLWIKVNMDSYSQLKDLK